MRAWLGLLLAAAPSLLSAGDIDSKTGLVIGPGFEIVSVQCTVCHSARLVTQNRADRDGWLAMIRWMQDTQGLWSLGDDESRVLDYLAANYRPRRLGASTM